MAFMFLRKTIWMDFDSDFPPENLAVRRNYYLCGYKFIVLFLLHVFGGPDLNHKRRGAAIPSRFSAEQPAR